MSTADAAHAMMKGNGGRTSRTRNNERGDGSGSSFVGVVRVDQADVSPSPPVEEHGGGDVDHGEREHPPALPSDVPRTCCAAQKRFEAPVQTKPGDEPEVVAKLAKAVPGASAAKITQAAQVVSSSGGSSSSKKKKAPHTISGPSHKQILINFGSGVIPPTSQADVMSSINATFRSHNRSIRMHGWILHYYGIPPHAWTDAMRLIVSLPMSTSYLKLVGVPFYKHGLTVEHTESGDVDMAFRQSPLRDF
ncbi:hypothetical protein NMY22_g20102 [Coprinellus aureogranulatus]|nr:hypothetical protein NMY22_g20102 [Coprinellus aureogranulatus]